MDGPRGRIGRDDLAPLVHDPETLCFVCGPPALVDEMPKILEELGITRAQYSDRGMDVTRHAADDVDSRRRP